MFASLGGARLALVACGHVHQYRSSEIGGVRHVWAPSTAYYIPDTRQPRYGLKQVGFVMHELREDGSHYSHFAMAAGTEDLCIADFPDAYGPLD
jgi:3',5'-cyclic-AMP phosphodiesterase